MAKEDEELPGFLPWQEDLQMFSQYLDRKEQLEIDHKEYMAAHPELKAILADFLQSLLIHKPDDVYQFAHDAFAPFAATSHQPVTQQEH